MNAPRPGRLLAMTLLLAGCDPAPVLPVLPPARILRWMQCQECRSEKDSVVAMGAGAVLDLRTLLLDGPPPVLVSLVANEIQKPMQAPNATYVPPAPQIDLLLEDFRSNYRVRASMALGAIGGDSARHALCAGKAMNFQRQEVVKAIASALVLTGGTCP